LNGCFREERLAGIGRTEGTHGADRNDRNPSEAVILPASVNDNS